MLREFIRSLPIVGRITLEGSATHWKGGTCHRRSNPRLIAFELVPLHYKLDGKRNPYFYGWRLWFYVRPNHALYAGFYFDWRPRNG